MKCFKSSILQALLLFSAIVSHCVQAKASESRNPEEAEPLELARDAITDSEYEKALDDAFNFYIWFEEPSPFVLRSEKIKSAMLLDLVNPDPNKAGVAAVMLAERGDPRGIYVMLGHSHRYHGEYEPIGHWAMQSLGGTGCKEGVSILLEALANEHEPEIVRALTDALVEAEDNSEKVINALIGKYKETKDSEIIRNIGYLKAKDALPFLIQCLDSEDQDTPSTAIYAIAEIGGKEAMAVLIKILNEQDENKRESVARSLSETDITGFEKELIPFLDDPNPNVKIPITFALAKLGNEKAISITINAFENDGKYDGEIEILGKIGDKRAIPILMKKINSDNPHISQDAITAIGKLNGKEALPKLIEIVNSTDLFEKDFENEKRMLFISAAWACLRIGDDSVISQIMNALEKMPKDWFIKAYAMVTIKRLLGDELNASYPYNESYIIDEAILLLADSKNKQATDYLESKGVKVSLLAPKSIEADKAIKELGTAFKSPSPTIRALAAKQAGVLGRMELVDGLEKLLDDEYYNVRDCTALSLGALKSEKSIPKLRAVKEDKMTRAAVEKALEMIGSSEESSH